MQIYEYGKVCFVIYVTKEMNPGVFLLPLRSCLKKFIIVNRIS